MNEEEMVAYLESKGYKITRPSKDVHDEYTFDRAWNLYQKKVGDKAKLKKKWNSLSLRDRKAATEYIPQYVISQPDKQYRKNFQTFLNQRGWEDELLGVNPEPPKPSTNSSSYEESKHIGERWKQAHEQKDDGREQKLRQRIYGMIQLLQANPKSLCKGQLIQYYNNGTLDRLDIAWKP